MSLETIKKTVAKLVEKSDKVELALDDYRKTLAHFGFLDWLDTTDIEGAATWAILVDGAPGDARDCSEAYRFEIDPRDAYEVLHAFASKLIEVAERRRNGGDV